MPNSSKWIDKANLSRFWDSIKHRFTIYEEQTTELMSKEADFEVSVTNSLPEIAKDAMEAKFGEDIADDVSDWLTEHVDPVGSAVVVDDTLSISGAAADAKAAGDEIDNLKSAVNQKNTILTDDLGYVFPTWEHGNISSSGESTTKLIARTGYIPLEKNNTIKVTFPNYFTSMRVLLYKYNSYDNNSYITLYNLTSGESLLLNSNDMHYIRFRAVGQNNVDVDLKRTFEINIEILTAGNRNDVVTPQMFGAKGDGVTDDRKAFQAALDTGKNVYIPMTNGECYVIKNHLEITTPYQTVFSIPEGNTPYGSINRGFIFWDTPDDDVPVSNPTALFLVKTHNAFFYGLTVKSIYNDGTYYGCFCYAYNEILDEETQEMVRVADVDLKIENCIFMRFKLLVHIIGRGFKFTNNAVGLCYDVFRFEWDNALQTVTNENSSLGQRGYVIQGNRFHLIPYRIMYVLSGHAFGLSFTDNIIDMGRGYVIYALDTLWHWVISNNTINYQARTAFTFGSGAKNCVITNNVINAEPKKWASQETQDYRPDNFIIAEDLDGCVISNNIFSGCKNATMLLTDAINCNIQGNVLNKTFTNDGSSDTPAEEPAPVNAFIELSGRLDKTIIKNNVATIDMTALFVGVDNAEAEADTCILTDNLYSNLFSDNINFTNCKIDE